MSAIIRSISSTGSAGSLVDIECSLSNNLPLIVIVGFANRAVGEAKERIRGAFADSQIVLPRKRITINLAPADVPKGDSGFDLAIAVSILAASNQIEPQTDPRQVFIAELGLDGSTRAVRGIIGKLLAGRARGVTHFFIPANNMRQAQLVPGIQLLPVKNLKQLFKHLNGSLSIKPISTKTGLLCDMPTIEEMSPTLQLSEIAGQVQAKRALIIAAAGGHNLFLSGPPGTGKSMLAKALPSLLPPLELEEMLEVTHLHSLASRNYDQILTQRPFRAPHHSASQAAIIGGGTNASTVRPGEISLAHRGVLVLDELPEFEREALEALRQPLENHRITIARAKDSVTYPAHFMFVATANPCPCGYYGVSGKCTCNQYRVKQYQHKVSGPILDRVDLFSVVHNVKHSNLLTTTNNQSEDKAAISKVQQARNMQAIRFASRVKLNADMSNDDIKQLAHLNRRAASLLNQAAEQLQLSPRAYMRSIKVARTIADLAGSAHIAESHIAEALTYRQPVFRMIDRTRV